MVRGYQTNGLITSFWLEIYVTPFPPTRHPEEPGTTHRHMRFRESWSGYPKPVRLRQRKQLITALIARICLEKRRFSARIILDHGPWNGFVCDRTADRSKHPPSGLNLSGGATGTISDGGAGPPQGQVNQKKEGSKRRSYTQAITDENLPQLWIFGKRGRFLPSFRFLFPVLSPKSYGHPGQFDRTIAGNRHCPVKDE